MRGIESGVGTRTTERHICCQSMWRPFWAIAPNSLRSAGLAACSWLIETCARSMAPRRGSLWMVDKVRSMWSMRGRNSARSRAIEMVANRVAARLIELLDNFIAFSGCDDWVDLGTAFRGPVWRLRTLRRRSFVAEHDDAPPPALALVLGRAGRRVGICSACAGSGWRGLLEERGGCVWYR